MPPSSPTVMPYGHAAIAVCSQITFFTLYYASYKHLPIADESNSSLMFALENNAVKNVQLLCAVVSLPMVFDLIVDVCSHVGYLAFAAEDHIHERGTIEYAKEWAIRFLYIIALSIPASLIYTSPNDIHKVELYVMVIMMRLSTLFCMVMFVMSTTFDCTVRGYIGSLGVSFLCCIGLLGQFTCFYSDQSTIGIKGWFYVATALELCFLTYTPIFVMGILILFIVTWRHNLILYNLTSADLIAHDVCIVIYALIATSLPVRIARLERLKARNMVVNAKKNVSHALNEPLRILLSELDLMLGDDSAMTTMNRDGVIRLARIALATDAAIGSLRRVADVTRFDRGDRGDNNSGSNEQLFSHEAISNNSDTGSNRPLITASKNKEFSEVVRMRRYNVRFDEESIAQGSHSRREGIYEMDGMGGSDYPDRVSSSSYRSSRSSRARSFRSTKLSSISDGTTDQTINGNHRYEDHHQHLSLLQTNTFHSVNFGHLQLAKVLQSEVRLDLGLGLDDNDSSQGQGREGNDLQAGRQALGSLVSEKQMYHGSPGLGVNVGEGQGIGLGLGEMLREELIVTISAHTHGHTDETNESHSSTSSGWAGGHYYPAEHKDPYNGQRQHLGQGQHQGQGQYVNQVQRVGVDLNGVNFELMNHSHPPLHDTDVIRGMQTLPYLEDCQFERPRQPQLLQLPAQQQPSQQLPPMPPLHDYRTSNGHTDLTNGKSGGITIAASSALSLADAAIRKSELLQLQGNDDMAVLEVQSALARLQEDIANVNTSTGNGASTVGVVDKTWSHSCALCHRRLGVLYKLMGRYEDAESSIRLYIAHLENNQGNIHNGNNATIHAKQTQKQDDSMHDLDMNLEQDLAVAYTLLSTIIGLSSDERSVEARQNDIRAGMLMETYRSSPRNSQKESTPLMKSNDNNR